MPKFVVTWDQRITWQAEVTAPTLGDAINAVVAKPPDESVRICEALESFTVEDATDA